ncbi:hypothetical protein HKD37_12G033979 [Glycine soja]
MPHNGQVRSLALSEIIGRSVRVTLFCENAPIMWDRHRLTGALKPDDPQGLHSEESVRASPSLFRSNQKKKHLNTQTLPMNYAMHTTTQLFSKS